MAQPTWIEDALALAQTLGFAVSAHEPMSRHTSFRVGGPADLLADPSAPEHVQALRSFASKCGTPFTVIGAGTNILVRDGGIRGIVCRIGNAMSRVSLVPGEQAITAQAGASIRSVCIAAGEAGLSGLEFAIGIPGHVGGGVVMNAGAHGGCLADAVTSVLSLSRDCEFVNWSASDLCFGYRHSALLGTDHIVLEATFGLSQGDPAAIRRRHEEILAKRRATQPTDLPSAGSVFRRPPGHYAGALIEAAGLKGARVGGAQVSGKHAGFIVNTGGATASDVLQLIEHVQRVVAERSGVMLEPEVLVLGEDAP